MNETTNNVNTNGTSKQDVRSYPVFVDGNYYSITDIDDAIEYFLKIAEFKGRAKATINNYRRDLNYFVEWSVNNLDSIIIDGDTLQAYFDCLVKVENRDVPSSRRFRSTANYFADFITMAYDATGKIKNPDFSELVFKSGRPKQEQQEQQEQPKPVVKEQSTPAARRQRTRKAVKQQEQPIEQPAVTEQQEQPKPAVKRTRQRRQRKQEQVTEQPVTEQQEQPKPTVRRVRKRTAVKSQPVKEQEQPKPTTEQPTNNLIKPASKSQAKAEYSNYINSLFKQCNGDPVAFYQLAFEHGYSNAMQTLLNDNK